MSRPKPQAVSPRDCALAVGIPLTREQFLSDLSRPGEKDFAGLFKRAAGPLSLSEEFYCDLFDQTACVARRVCDEVERRGVTVVRAARPSDLPELFRRCRVVTLVTHFRFTPIPPEDILDPRAILRTLRTPAGRMQQAASRAVRARDPHLFEAFDEERGGEPAPHYDALRARLASALDDVAAEAHAYYSSGGPRPGSAPDEDALLRLTRDELEHLFDGLIARDKCLEFADAMAPISDLVAVVPPDHEGPLDLTTCNSVIPGRAVKRLYTDYPVAMNRYPAHLHVRMAKYNLVIAELARRPAPFFDTMRKF